MNRSRTDQNAWYHYFWPWFIVALLAISVAASLYSVSLAYGLGHIEMPADPPASPLGVTSKIDVDRAQHGREH